MNHFTLSIAFASKCGILISFNIVLPDLVWVHLCTIFELCILLLYFFSVIHGWLHFAWFALVVKMVKRATAAVVNQQWDSSYFVCSLSLSQVILFALSLSLSLSLFVWQKCSIIFCIRKKLRSWWYFRSDWLDAFLRFCSIP